MTKKNYICYSIGTFIVFISCAFFRFIAVYPPNLRYDPASVALQAFQILDGYRPIFWPGQAFMSAIGAYIIAFLFKFLEPSVFLLNLFGYFSTIIFTALTIIAAYRLFNIKTAFFTSLFFLIPTKTMMYWSSQARPDYEICFILVPIILILTNSINNSFQKKESIFLKSVFLGLLSGLGMWNNMAIAPLLLVTFSSLAISLNKSYLKVFVASYVFSFVIGFFPVIYFNINNGFLILKQGSFNNISNISDVIKNFITHAYPYFFGVKYKVFTGFLSRFFLNFFLLWIFTLYVAFFIKLILKIYRKENIFPFILIFSYLLVHLFISATSNFGARFAKISHPTLYISTLYAIAFTIPAYVISSIKSLKVRILVFSPIIIYFTANVYDTHNYFKNFSEAFKVNGFNDIIKLPENNEPFNFFIKENNLDGGYYLGRKKMMQSVKSGNRVIFSDFYKEMYIPYALSVDGGKNIFWANHSQLSQILNQINCEYKTKYLKTPQIYYKNGKKDYSNEFTIVYYDFIKHVYRETLINDYIFHSSSSFPADSFINDNNVETLWKLNNKETEHYFEISFKEPIYLSKIILFPKDESTCPKNYSVSCSYDGENYFKQYSIYGGMPLFWSAYHPFMKIIKPRIEYDFSKLNMIKSVRFDFSKDFNKDFLALSEILIYKKDFNESIDKKNFYSCMESLLTRIINNYGSWLIYSDHFFQNYFKKEGLNTEFISNFSVNNTGKKNPHYRKHIPMRFNGKTIILSSKAERSSIESVLGKNIIAYKIKEFDYYDIFEINEVYDNNKLYWNGLNINNISKHDNYIPLKKYYKNLKELNINFENNIKLLNFYSEYNEEKKQYSLFFEWLPFMQIERGFYLFIHFINEKEEILLQADMPLVPSFSDKWIPGKIEICEQYVKDLKPIQQKLRLRIGIWNPETGKRFKNNFDEKNYLLIDL